MLYLCAAGIVNYISSYYQTVFVTFELYWYQISYLIVNQFVGLIFLVSIQFSLHLRNFRSQRYGKKKVGDFQEAG